MNLAMLRMIISIAYNESAVYIEGEGASCPLCSKLGIHPPRVRAYNSTSGGTGVRYHACPQCGLRFKSIERESSKMLQTLDVKPKKKHTRERKS